MGSLQAVVIGAGWAGEGHTIALRHAGVNVAALCARRIEALRAAADKLGVAQVSTDWRAALEQIQPDIVAIATPASLRREVVEVAAARGCHLFCDKPLALTAREAEGLYQLAEQAGVRHAYAATHSYEPSAAWLSELVQDGAIGRLYEIVCTFRVGFPALLPWGWINTLDNGGGAVQGALPHLLGILETITSGKLVRTMGEARTIRESAPVVPGLSGDLRVQMAKAMELSPDTATALEWRSCDADDTFSALLRFETPSGEVQVTITLDLFGRSFGMSVPGTDNVMRLYGENGMLAGEGMLSYKVSRVRAPGEEPEALPVPQRLLDKLPQVGDDVQNKWCALARDFVADIRGEEHRPYLTFQDGWRYQEAIDAIRLGNGWHPIPSDTQQTSIQVAGA